MRYLTLAFFLMLIMGCGDMAGNDGGATGEMGMEEAPAVEAAMEEASDGPPQWQVLEQNVVHSE